MSETLYIQIIFRISVFPTQVPSQQVESAASDISRYESASSVMAEALPSVVPETGRLPSQQQPAAAAKPVPAPQRRFVGFHQEAHAQSF